MSKSPYVPIISAGAIGTPNIGDGKIIPVLVLDCENHPEFINLVEIHQSTPPGDVVSKWGYMAFNTRFVELHLSFSKPVELVVRLKIDLDRYLDEADAIVQTHALYLQPSTSGHKVSEGIDRAKILIEIPPETKLHNWDWLLLRRIKKRLKHKGIPKKQIKNAAIEHLETMRRFVLMRNK